MALSKEQIIGLIKEPREKRQLLKAVKHEQRVRFHAEEATEDSLCSPYLKDFLQWVDSLLPNDKATMFKKIMGFPLYTNELVKGIAEEYMKVYDSQNSSFTYEFSNENIESEFRSFLRTTDFFSKWKDDSAEAMMTAINSIVVIDMPAEESDDPEPYYYLMNISELVDVRVNRKGEIEYLISQMEDNKYLVIDDEKYVIYLRTQNDFTETLSSTHDLGYCPACFFWKESMNKRSPVVKRSPLSQALTNLDWLLFFENARRCLETYAAYPIFVSFKDKCTYQAEKNGEKYPCTGGVINMGVNGTTECPACSKNKLIGPGTMFKVPMPVSKDQPSNIDAVKVIPAERDSLDYCKERSTEIWDEIFYDSVGYGGDDMQSAAVNEKQVRAGFESKQNILIGLKENLEVSLKFIIDTFARLKFGEAFKSSSVNLGTDFYLKSSAEAVSEYKDAKLAGVPQYYITHKRNQIDSITTKGNDSDAERLNILKHLEPWLDISLNEAKNLGFDASNREQFLLKADFNRLILKFESEYGSIVEFGSLVDFKIKIDRIYQTLINYVKKEYPGQPKEGQPDPGTGGNTGGGSGS